MVSGVVEFVVAQQHFRLDTFFDVSGLENALVVGRVGPDARPAVGMEFGFVDGVGLSRRRCRNDPEFGLQVVGVFVGNGQATEKSPDRFPVAGSVFTLTSPFQILVARTWEMTMVSLVPQ